MIDPRHRLVRNLEVERGIERFLKKERTHEEINHRLTMFGRERDNVDGGFRRHLEADGNASIGARARRMKRLMKILMTAAARTLHRVRAAGNRFLLDASVGVCVLLFVVFFLLLVR